uniref:Ribonuclease PH n=1 Tax=Lygus hesperus TaxID=30085 RepID=A0A0A9VU06_LYGHE
MVKSKASKRSQKSNRSNASQCTDEIVQCPHLHFKSDVIDRNVLSKEQHLNLLSTPKGYRWEEASDKKEDGQGEGTENLPTHLPRRVVCSGRRMKKPEKVYVHNFLAEVWTFLTPEMIDRLKGMLMNEFGMSPQEALKFLEAHEKAAPGKKSGKLNLIENNCQGVAGSLKNFLHVEFKQMVSNQLEDRVYEYLCGLRSKNQKAVSKAIHSGICQLIGEEFRMERPDNVLHTIVSIGADVLAQWLEEAVNEADMNLGKRARKLKQ